MFSSIDVIIYSLSSFFIASNLSTRIKIAKEKILTHVEVLGCYKVTVSFCHKSCNYFFPVLFDVNLFKVIFDG